jgi:hypothetical protein
MDIYEVGCFLGNSILKELYNMILCNEVKIAMVPKYIKNDLNLLITWARTN